MRRSAVLFLLILLAACGDERGSRPVSEPGEKLHPVRGTIISRRVSDNTLLLDHEAIPGFMAAMKMDYAVRGAKVGELPADGKRIQAQLHVTQRSFWITDVKPIP